MTDAQSLQRIALEVAQEAATFILRGFRGELNVSTKGPEAELFTQYDVGAEDLVRERLGRLTPTLPVVGEERGGEADAELAWYVDPIDGTINYIAGHPYFCVSLGVMRGDAPLAGAVVAPALGLSWSGSVGGGAGRFGRAERNGVPCAVSATKTLAESIVTTGFPARSGMVPVEHERRLRQYGELVRSVREVRRCGSAALDLCLVADGTYQAYWMPRIGRWDTAAGAAILLGAGGRWTIVADGRPEAFELGTNGTIEPALLALLPA